MKQTLSALCHQDLIQTLFSPIFSISTFSNAVYKLTNVHLKDKCFMTSVVAIIKRTYSDIYIKSFYKY